MPLRVLLITQNTNVKIPKYPQRQSFFFVFSDAKIVICLYSEIKKNLNILVEESQGNVYLLAKRREIKSETTITIHSKISLDL